MNVRNGKFPAFLLLIAILFTTFTPIVEAGFGITPPYVRNSSLTRNSTYEQSIMLVRGDTSVAQRAEITIDAPEIEEWIEIVEGQNISLPQGEQKVPMTVRVRVPDDAEFRDYGGRIRIRTLPDDGVVTSGAVSISLGAIVDINLTIIDREIFDFRVRQISIPDLNEGSKVGWLFFPGKIAFNMLIENTGNIDVTPTDVKLRIFDRTGRVMLEETSMIGRPDEVPPYGTETVTAEIPTRLPVGTYIARYQVFNQDEIEQEGELTLNIRPAGTVQAAGFGFVGLSIAHKVSVLLPIFAILIALIYFIHSLRSERKRRR
jgi:hypothetical protein